MCTFLGSGPKRESTQQPVLRQLATVAPHSHLAAEREDGVCDCGDVLSLEQVSRLEEVDVRAAVLHHCLLEAVGTRRGWGQN